jgi:glycosyltransferase involved in cell wall biosynthesis
VALVSTFTALIAGGGAVVTSGLWLLEGFAVDPGFIRLHRFVVASALGAATVLFLDLWFFYRFFVPHRGARHLSLDGARVHVGLTCYDDEEAISLAVRDFKSNPHVHRVVVVDNGSRDGSVEAAKTAGADQVTVESAPGYGACCMRALREAAVGADVIILCEGDMTFSASDVPKLVAYLENSDLVLGTRATQELRERDTQMDWLINPFNQLVAKLHQVRFFGTRLTDVGCTYRAIRKEAYLRLEPHLRVQASHFSPHMFIEALRLDMQVIEVPIYFRKRVGRSKGVGTSKWKAAQVATAMLWQLFRA